VANDVTGFVEHLAALEVDKFKMGLKQRKIVGLQSGEQPVCAMIGLRSMGHGDTVTPAQITRIRADGLSRAGSTQALSKIR
jgi:hypothetical protein